MADLGLRQAYRELAPGLARRPGRFRRTTQADPRVIQDRPREPQEMLEKRRQPATSAEGRRICGNHPIALPALSLSLARNGGDESCSHAGMYGGSFVCVIVCGVVGLLMGGGVWAVKVRPEAPCYQMKESPNSLHYLGAWHQTIAGRGVHAGQKELARAEGPP